MAQTTPFSVLALPERFDLSDSAIEEAWRRTIALVHPDRFAGRPASERRVAEQWAGCINEAKDALTDPVKRAQALLAIAGVDTGAETDTKMPADFLMQQLEWREMLENAETKDALDEVSRLIETERTELLAALTQDIDVAKDWSAAREKVRRLMFVQKIREELLKKQAAL